jgi:hypothetical protein
MIKKTQITLNLKLISTKNLYRLAIKKEWRKIDEEKIKKSCILQTHSKFKTPLVRSLFGKTWDDFYSRLKPLFVKLRGTFFKNRTKSKIGKKNIFDFYIFDFIFGFLILKLVDE